MQTESDQAAFGTREDKLQGCANQRRAWDVNALLLAPIMTKIRAPMPLQWRRRAEFGAAARRQREATILRNDQFQLAEEEMDAKRLIEDAVDSEINSFAHV